MKMFKIVPLVMLLLLSSVMVKADNEGFLGQITLFPGSFAPKGYKYCEGQLLRISENQALFSLLGTIYGGDGRTTFALPNLKEAEKALNSGVKNSRYGVRYIIKTKGKYPSRS